MPVLSCGGMRCQQGGTDLDLSTLDQEKHANHEAVLRRALELGVNHYETARGYGSSELEMGLVLAKLPREQFLLQTKISPKEDPRVFVDEVNDSIKRLQVDALDLLTLHGVN
ncbi:MAG: aldo/keto reductase, partial [Phycisphaeraceae bacterium]|nr:aldo/keto reductase [Phycisphaeraceae bacterium]